MHYQQFKLSLYEEHISEIMFLLEQRLSLLEQWELQWPDITDEELRIEAHIDGLVIGGTAAQNVLMTQLRETPENPFLCSAALTVALRTSEPALFNQIIDIADTHSPEVRQAIRQTCRDITPDAATFSPTIEALATRAALEKVLSIVPLFVGNSKLVTQVIHRCEQLSDTLFLDYIECVAATKSAQASPCLLPFLSHTDPTLRQRAVTALCQHADQQVAPYLEAWAESESWAVALLALITPERSLNIIHQLAVKQRLSRDAVYCLGLMGTPEAVAVLTSLLEDEALQQAAIQSLFVIFGGGPMLPEEKTAAALGVLDQTSVHHFVGSAALWRAYVAEQVEDLAKQRATRFGKPRSAASQIMALRSPIVPMPMRRWLYLEAHRDKRIPLSVNALSPVSLQLKHLL